MPKRFHYSEKIDKHIYDVKDGCETTKEHADLIVAILDQMGAPIDLQNEMGKKLYRSFNLGDYQVYVKPYESKPSIL